VGEKKIGNGNNSLKKKVQKPKETAWGKREGRSNLGIMGSNVGLLGRNTVALEETSKKRANGLAWR